MRRMMLQVGAVVVVASYAVLVAGASGSAGSGRWRAVASFVAGRKARKAKRAAEDRRKLADSLARHFRR